MATGRLDLYIAKLPNNTVVLTLGCTDSASELLTIPRNTPLVLTRGTIKAPNVNVQFLEGRECFADFVEMNFELAHRLQLQALRRYSLNYASSSKSLIIQPTPISEATAVIHSQTATNISIGYELVSKLGIPERQGLPIRVRNGKYIAGLRLQVPANLSDDRMRLPAYWLNKWRLSANVPYKLQYDQRYSVLSLSPIHTPVLTRL
ncbi:hypothetical protein [Cohnella yongneupensis]|uniref:Uncharacterized protein n=1 Tax=Cohnella yongneupensis TaxID=425006 RepID=A0ABW0R729_9BACL